MLRVHSDTDCRNNPLAGGRAEPAEPATTAEDQRIIDVLRPHLKTLGLHFVGLDINGRYLTAVNVTSPTCLQEINAFNGQQLEDRVIEYMERLVHNVLVGPDVLEQHVRIGGKQQVPCLVVDGKARH